MSDGMFEQIFGFQSALRQDTLSAAVSAMRAQPADIPGLWSVPGYPELTTNQLLQVALTNVPVDIGSKEGIE